MHYNFVVQARRGPAADLCGGVVRVLVFSDRLHTWFAELAPRDYALEFVHDAISMHQALAASAFDLVFVDFAVHDSVWSQTEKSASCRWVLVAESVELQRSGNSILDFYDAMLSWPCSVEEFYFFCDNLFLSLRSEAELQLLRKEQSPSGMEAMLASRNVQMRHLLEMLQQVAPTNSSVLIGGETGVGKSLLARWLHQSSARAERSFLHVHCGALAESLLESELFGHEQGAFTGAVKRKMGKFELADGGSLFLDEVSTLSPSAQVKLLQVMQDGVFQRVGGEQDIRVNVRVIAASNESLAKLVEEGKFRKDLYYRLNVFPVEIPPLRERPEDVESFLYYFLRRQNATGAKQIKAVQPELIAALKLYPWPGNIRELENLVERAFILEKSSILSLSSFPKELFEAQADHRNFPLNTALSLAEARARNTENFEKEYLNELLKSSQGRINRAAERAGISVRQINHLMNKYRLRKEDFRELTQ